MKILNKTLTAQEIRNLNINKDDVLGFDFQYKNKLENNYLTVNGKRIVSFINLKDRKKSFDKIKRMGFGYGYKNTILTDEEEGVIQAVKNNENPFAYSILCSNSKMNEIIPLKLNN